MQGVGAALLVPGSVALLSAAYPQAERGAAIGIWSAFSAVAAAGFAGFALPSVGATYWAGFFPAVCVLGLGMAITVAPLTTTVMNALGPERAGTASGVNNAVSRGAGLLAIAAFGIILTGAFDARLSHALAALPLTPDALSAVLAQRQKLAGIVLPEGLADPLKSGLQRAIGESIGDRLHRVHGNLWLMDLGHNYLVAH